MNSTDRIDKRRGWTLDDMVAQALGWLYVVLCLVASMFLWSSRTTLGTGTAALASCIFIALAVMGMALTLRDYRQSIDKRA